MYIRVIAPVAAGLAAIGLAPVFARAEAPTFNRDIRPLLSDRCYACHGPDAEAREAELRLDSFDGATEWAVVPGESAESEVIARITSDDPDLRMPPVDSNKKPITPAEADLIKRWIDAGAEYQRHWAYIAPSRAEVPEVDGNHWPRNAIDRFLLAKQESSGVVPAAEADRVTLVRRLYLDVVGMPPSRNEIDEFLLDSRADAYEQLVDKLLASPHFGERMASWWFDLVRFANTVGYHGDQTQNVTPYRDYVIKSFNDNLPFDQFTVEQLAGDLLESPTLWQRVATGYTRLNQTTHEGGAQDGEYRVKTLADRVRNFSEVWLAGSMGCAECHDHKFDPYAQKEFYQMAAFFADVDKHGAFVDVGDNANPTTRPPEILAWTLPLFEQINQVDAQIAKTEKKLGRALSKDFRKLQDELAALKIERVKLEAQYEPQMVADAVQPSEVRVLPRGNWMDKSGDVVEPATPACLPPLDVQGRRATRLDLARWLTDRDHPLTARVFVNRLWKIYFGQGFTKVLIDMGSQADWPAQPELLDWLAVEFIDSGWDVKQMVRLIVTSSAYRQSSAPRPELAQIDPDGNLVARQRRWRLDAEQIRDLALCVSGLLDPRVGGVIAKPYQPAGYYSALNFPVRKYKASKGADQFRRAVYTHWQRQYLHPWLVAFDAPSREECTAQRPISNTPSAALVLLNDPSFVEAARALAGRVMAEGDGDDRARLAWAWRETLLRDPSPAELKPIVRLLERGRQEFGVNEQAAKGLISVGASKPLEDADPAELAAWTSVCRVLLNLNETITRN